MGGAGLDTGLGTGLGAGLGAGLGINVLLEKFSIFLHLYKLF